MRVLVTLLTLTACNQVFGVESTGLVDAPTPIDAAVDAPPPACPTDGSVPVFKNELVNVPARYCTYYSVSEALGEAAALCVNEGGFISSVGAGPLDGPLVQQVLDPPPGFSGDTSFSFTPDGQQIVITGYEYRADGSYVFKTVEYTRTATQWTFARSYSLGTVGSYYTLSSSSAGPDRRALLHRWDEGTQTHVVDELHQPAGSWATKDTYSVAEIGVTSPVEMALSADGLRFVVSTYESVTGSGGGSNGPVPSPPETGNNEKVIYYASRSSLGERFGAARRMATVPEGVHSPYMTENCGRIYFSALNSVWYLRQ